MVTITNTQLKASIKLANKLAFSELHNVHNHYLYVYLHYPPFDISWKIH
jgi:hypothetical protein